MFINVTTNYLVTMGTLVTEVSMDNVFSFVSEYTKVDSVSTCEYLPIYSSNRAVFLSSS